MVVDTPKKSIISGELVQIGIDNRPWQPVNPPSPLFFLGSGFAFVASPAALWSCKVLAQSKPGAEARHKNWETLFASYVVHDILHALRTPGS